MDLRRLRYFVEIAHLRSLTAAAELLYVAQSALSRQMRLLEEDVGVRLLVREARGVSLTAAGELLLSRAKVLLRDADNIKAELAAVTGEPAGRLQIGAPPSLRTMLMAPFAGDYMLRHPKVTLGFREGTSRHMRDALASGEIDMAVVSNQEDLAGFVTEDLLTEPLCWVGPPDAPIRLERPVAVSRLASQPLILTAYPNSLRLLVDRALARCGLQIPPVAEADMVQMMVELIQRRLGYTVLPLSAVDEQLRQASLRAARIRGVDISWVVATSRQRDQVPAVRAAAALVSRIASSKIASGAWPYAVR